jgi:hypothetical protein
MGPFNLFLLGALTEFIYRREEPREQISLENGNLGGSARAGRRSFGWERVYRNLQEKRITKL